VRRNIKCEAGEKIRKVKKKLGDGRDGKASEEKGEPYQPRQVV